MIFLDWQEILAADVADGERTVTLDQRGDGRDQLRQTGAESDEGQSDDRLRHAQLLGDDGAVVHQQVRAQRDEGCAHHQQQARRRKIAQRCQHCAGEPLQCGCDAVLHGRFPPFRLTWADTILVVNRFLQKMSRMQSSQKCIPSLCRVHISRLKFVLRCPIDNRRGRTYT